MTGCTSSGNVEIEPYQPSNVGSSFSGGKKSRSRSRSRTQKLRKRKGKSKGSSKKRKGKGTNPWFSHVKNYAKSKKISYRDALSDPGCKNSYKKL